MQQHVHESEAHETLKRALDIDAEVSGVPTSLEEAARELGISAQTMARAQLEVKAEKMAVRVIRDHTSTSRRMFWWHLGLFILVNVFGVMVEVATGGRTGAWGVIGALGWTVGLAAHAISAFKPIRLGKE